MSSPQLRTNMLHLLLIAGAFSQTHAQSPIPAPINGPITVRFNGRQTCLDLPNGAINEGTGIQLWKCGRPVGPNQTWVAINLSDNFFLIKNYQSGKCLDVINGSSDNGANIIQSTCNASSVSQQWNEAFSLGLWPPAVKLVNRNSGKCLEAPTAAASSDANGQLFRQWSCDRGRDALQLLSNVAY